MMSPFAAIVMMTLVTALEDCTNAVSNKPTPNNKKGFFIVCSID